MSLSIHLHQRFAQTKTNDRYTVSQQYDDAAAQNRRCTTAQHAAMNSTTQCLASVPCEALCHFHWLYSVVARVCYLYSLLVVYSQAALTHPPAAGGSEANAAAVAACAAAVTFPASLAEDSTPIAAADAAWSAVTAVALAPAVGNKAPSAAAAAACSAATALVFAVPAESSEAEEDRLANAAAVAAVAAASTVALVIPPEAFAAGDSKFSAAAVAAC